MPPKPILRVYSDLRPLRDPVLICAFTGRGGGSAAAAVQYVVDQWDASPVAELDPEECFDFTVRRPIVRLENGVRIVNWPKNQFFVARNPATGRDFVLMPGIEPHIRWRAFCEAITEALLMVGSRTAVILGSRTAALPHTRPVPFRLVTTEPSFGPLFDAEATVPNYEGPTGITTVLSQRLTEVGISTAMLTALSPFYVQSEPNPSAVIALVRAIDRAYGSTTNLDALLTKQAEVTAATETAAAQAAELRSAITSLEEQYDREHGIEPTPAVEPPVELPSGTEAVAELEEFLRQLRGGGDSEATSN
jgi:predicted ATP-grasp superfamily ATP-dependent carboligase